MSEEMLRANSDVPDATPFHDVRGRATAVVGDRWRLDYDLFPDIGFRSTQPIAEGMRAEILDALRGEGGSLWNGSLADSEFDLPLNYQRGGGDTYFAGKMLARLARLVAISEELGDAGQPYFESLLNRLSERLEVWLGPGAEAPFLYDASWGGLISCGCASGVGAGGQQCAGSAEAPETCEGLRDPGINFGNGFYNDHHFHYGYFVYAAAVVARNRPEWERRWRVQIEALIRDYGNPTATDGDFPLARHMEWFTGLSWASGISGPLFNGRSQDTASEAVNAYYALHAYGASVDTPLGRELRGFGRLLAAMEAHAARTYRFALARSAVYGDRFSDGPVGTLWEHQAQPGSRFGAARFAATCFAVACRPVAAISIAAAIFFSDLDGPDLVISWPLAAASALRLSASSCFLRMISAVLSADLMVEFPVPGPAAALLAARSRSRSRWLPRVIPR